MQTPKTNCPRCNSRQSFPRLKRPTSLPLDGVQEAYVRCTMCHWEEVLEYTTPELERINRQKRQAGERATAERQRLGAQSRNTSSMLLRLVHSSSELTHEINERVRDAKRADTNAA